MGLKAEPYFDAFSHHFEETLIMLIKLKKFEDAGFYVKVSANEIEILGPPMQAGDWEKLKGFIATKTADPALQEFVIGGFMLALQRAQILELAE